MEHLLKQVRILPGPIYYALNNRTSGMATMAISGRHGSIVDGMMDVNVPELELASDEERARRRPMRTAVYSIRKQLELIAVPGCLDEYRTKIVDIIVDAADQIENLIDEDGE